MARPPSRRRFLSVLAGAAAIPFAAQAGSTVSWRGTALGAPASITLGGTGRADAQATFAAIEAELTRLEEVFSLYRGTSALSRLNRSGMLDNPPDDLVAVLHLSDTIHRATKGAFDPSIQPLWRALALSVTDKQAISAARDRVGWSRVKVSADRVAFADAGMALTLNGIAQGHITDCIAALLRKRGFHDVLIDMGEISASGTRHGAPWEAGIATRDRQVIRRITLRDRCLATSAAMGTLIDPFHRVGHILDPRHDDTGEQRRLVAVSAGRAAIADGLSTGCCLLSEPDAAAAIQAFPGARLETLI